MRVQVEQVATNCPPATCEMAGSALKLKYRAPKTKGTNKSSPSGNSGTPVRGTPPHGMRRRHRPGAKRY